MYFLLHCKPNLEFVFAIITLAPLKKSVLSLLTLKAVMCHYITTAAHILAIKGDSSFT